MFAVVYFAVGSVSVGSDLPVSLKPLADSLRADPKARATISGYHSSTGDAAQNHELAKGRATAVQAALAAAGVPADRLVLEKPIVEQANVAGEDPKARRVEVTVK